jgi:hypothetical protein
MTGQKPRAVLFWLHRREAAAGPPRVKPISTSRGRWPWQREGVSARAPGAAAAGLNGSRSRRAPRRQPTGKTTHVVSRARAAAALYAQNPGRRRAAGAGRGGGGARPPPPPPPGARPAAPLGAPARQAGVGPRTGGQSSAATGGILVEHGRRRRRRECSQPHAKAGRKGHRGDKSEGRRASRTGRCAQRLGGGYRGVGRRRSGGGVWGAGGTLRSARARCHGAAKQPISTAGRTANAGLSQRWPHEARVPPQRGARAHTQCFLEGGSSAWGRRSAQGSGATEAWAAGARAQGAPARRETRSHHDSHATRCVFSPR